MANIAGYARRVVGYAACLALLVVVMGRSNAEDADPSSEPGASQQLTELLNSAPAGTWGVVTVDIEAFLESRLAPGRIPPGMKRPDRAPAVGAFFLKGPGEGATGEPDWCGVARFADGADLRVLEDMFGAIEPTTLEGIDAHRTRSGRLFVVSDEKTVLCAYDAASMKELLSLRKGKAAAGLTSELQRLVEGHANASLVFAFVTTDEMSEGGLPSLLRSSIIGFPHGDSSNSTTSPVSEHLARMRAGLVIVDVTHGLGVEGRVTFRDAESAEHAADRARASNTKAIATLRKLENQEGWESGAFASMMVPIVKAEKLVRESIEFAAHGTTLHVKLNLTSAELDGITPHNWPVPPLWVAAMKMHRGEM